MERRRPRALLSRSRREDRGGAGEGRSKLQFRRASRAFQSDQKEPVATSEQVAYDVTRDGQRFLINTYVKNGKIQPMTVVLNWDAESKKK